MKITVTIDIPPGNACYYPPKSNEARGHSCGWKLTHAAAGKKWCRVFSDADVTGGFKCAECIRVTNEVEAALAGKGAEG